MTKLDRRTALQMLGLGAAGSALVGEVAFAQAKDSVTIGWPSDVPSWDPNQRFTPDAQPIFKLVFDQPLDQNEKLELDAEADHQVGARGRRPEHDGRTARRRHVPQRRQDDRGGFQLHLLRAHQGRPQGRHRELLAQGDRHRDRLAHQGGDEVQLAGADRAAMARVPRQLHGAEEATWRRSASTRSARSRSAPGPTSWSNTS